MLEIVVEQGKLPRARTHTELSAGLTLHYVDQGACLIPPCVDCWQLLTSAFHEGSLGTEEGPAVILAKRTIYLRDKSVDNTSGAQAEL